MMNILGGMALALFFFFSIVSHIYNNPEANRQGIQIAALFLIAAAIFLK